MERLGIGAVREWIVGQLAVGLLPKWRVGMEGEIHSYRRGDLVLDIYTDPAL